ncbi:MAG: hypothetical protein Q8873_07610 [Bacillota bacterium]|nr:hypothetical protein [Bacillota bacterium]
MDKYKKKKKTSGTDPNYYDMAGDLTDFKSVSSQDSTGLIPSKPEDNAELESYEDTYDYLSLVDSEDKDKWTDTDKWTDKDKNSDKDKWKDDSSNKDS